MGKVKDDSYFVVQGWMLNQLHLKGNTLQVFAIIHGFSHSEDNEYKGSLQYLCEFTGASRSTVIRSLTDLQERGLIDKREVYENGVKFNRYKSSVDMMVCFDTGGSKMTPPPFQNDTTPSVKMTPHNIESNNIADNLGNNPYNPLKGERAATHRRAKAPDYDADGFAAFWAAYPKKAGKADALKAWNKLAPDVVLQEQMGKALEVQKQSQQWRKDGGQYIPMPSTWLNGRRWEDEAPQAQSQESQFDRMMAWAKEFDEKHGNV